MKLIRYLSDNECILLIEKNNKNKYKFLYLLSAYILLNYYILNIFNF